MNTHVLPFGRHRGEPLSSVPTDYLAWLARTVPLSSGLRGAVAAELQRRGVPCSRRAASPAAASPPSTGCSSPSERTP
jgi:hypothetical protein